jgi:hypothetical protein
LKALDKADAERRETADLKNALEGYTYEMKERLDDELIQSVTTEAVRRVLFMLLLLLLLLLLVVG